MHRTAIGTGKPSPVVVGDDPTVRWNAPRTGGLAGLLLSVPAALAWVSGLPFVFPSLGPTAFVMATVSEPEPVAPRRVVGGHLVGAVAGFLAYHLLAPGIVVTATLVPLSLAGVQLGASAVASVAATAAGMQATDTVHPPACATTLIVSLGLLSTPGEVAVLMAGVVLLAGVDRIVRRWVRARGG